MTEQEALNTENTEETTAAAPENAEAPAVEAAPPAEEKTADTPKAKKASPAVAKKEGNKVTNEEIMEAIKTMTVMELSTLVKALEEEFGVSAAAPVAVAAAATDAAPAADVEEKTDFNVILKEVGPNKINVIKAVRELTSLGLKESKELVEGAPKAVKESINKDDAAAAKKKLEEAGATAEIT